MTNEAKIRAMAELEGCKNMDQCEYMHRIELWWVFKQDGVARYINDYLTDLNATRKVMMALPVNIRRSGVTTQLRKILHEENNAPVGLGADSYFVEATAEQLTDAILKATGKWDAAPVAQGM